MVRLTLVRGMLAMSTMAVVLTGCGSQNSYPSPTPSTSYNGSRSSRSMELGEGRTSAASVDSNCSVVNGAVR